MTAIAHKSYKAGVWNTNTGHALTHSQLVSPTTDVVVLGDSWAAFGHHRGADVPVLSVDIDTWFNGAVNITMWNAPLGMTSTGDPNDPRMVNGYNLNGRRGFSSPVTGKGRFVEALQRAGIDPSIINLHEYACGGTTAGLYGSESTSGAYNQGMPTRIDPVPGVGSDYGTSTPSHGGMTVDGGTSVWMNKQNWLQDAPHVGHPWRDWTLCDMIAHPPTGKLVVLMSLGGNDVFGLSQVLPFADVKTGEFDPDNAFANRWSDIKTNIKQIIDTIYMLNPNAEIVWTSYCNFPIDDANLANPKIKLPTDYAPSPTTPNSWGPVGWNVYEDDGPNAPDPDFTGQNHNIDTLPLAYYPGGRNMLTLPFIWNPSSDAFMRVYGGWFAYVGQRDAGYDLVKYWMAHQLADSYAWQGQGTAAHPGFWSGYSWIDVLGPTQSYGHNDPPPFYWWIIDGWGPTQNYRWMYGDGSGSLIDVNWYIRSSLATYQGHRWDQIYSRTVQLLVDSETINNAIFFSSGDFLSGHQLATIVTKDITTKNIARLFRDFMRPCMIDVTDYYHGQGKRFIAVDTFDIGPHDSDNSQDDPINYPAMPAQNFVEGVHLSTLGIDYWQDHVVTTLLAKTQVLGVYTPVAVSRKVRYGNNWL